MVPEGNHAVAEVLPHLALCYAGDIVTDRYEENLCEKNALDV